jgi:SAM-dependent methyltransferase
MVQLSPSGNGNWPACTIMDEAAHRHRSGGELSAFLASLEIDQQYRWAYDNFEHIVAGLIREFGFKDVCELGGGRRPFLSRERITELNLDYVVNDIDASELSRAPYELAKACFDLSAITLPAEFHERFDFVFSHMLMEHVSDGRMAYRNIFRMLRDKGVFFNLHPVLYSPAMVLNWIMPEKITEPFLRLLQPHRGSRKFPAHYSYCVVSGKTKQMLHEVGFREVFLLPFYGHDYLRRVPMLQSVDDALSGFARRRGLNLLATLCFTIGRK